MSDDTFVCAREDCEAVTKRKTHNQKYCTDECCRLATNRRIMEKYYAKRDQRLGKARYCRNCEKTRLSRYNDSLICSPCKLKREVDANNSVLEMLNASSIAV